MSRINQRMLRLLLVGSGFMVSAIFFSRGQYQLVMLFLVLVSCLPVIQKYEQKTVNTKELVILAVWVTIAVISRSLFFMLPAVTPMTAIIIIAGICLGADNGFLVGVLAAVTSNILFGQGPWTPFQMFSWGLIGFVAGLPYIQKQLKQHYFLLALYGVGAGLFFSFFMDVWTMLSLDHMFSWRRYLALIISAFPYTVTYCISNVFFSLLLFRTMERRLARILRKYAIETYRKDE